MTSETMITDNKGGFKDQKSFLLYHNSYDSFNNVVSIVTEPPYDKLKSQYIRQATVRISLGIYPYITLFKQAQYFGAFGMIRNLNVSVPDCCT